MGVCLMLSFFPFSESFGQITHLIEISTEISRMTNAELLDLSTQYDLEYKSREASFELAERYFYGLGADRNLERAAYYFEMSANPVSGEYFVDENGKGRRLIKSSPFNDAAYERLSEIKHMVSNSKTSMKSIEQP